MNKNLIKNYFTDSEITKDMAVCFIDEHKVAIATNATTPIVGFACEVSKNGRVDICHSGVVNAIASSPIGAGKQVSNDNGKIKEAVAGDYVIGVAITKATATNDFIKILLK